MKNTERSTTRAARRQLALALAAMAGAAVAGPFGYWLGSRPAAPVSPSRQTAPAAPAVPVATTVTAGRLAGTLKLVLPAVSSANPFLPLDYTCYRTNLSPALRWSGAPDGTKSFVILFARPKVGKTEAAGWAVYNLPGDATGLPAGKYMQAKLEDGASQARNDRGSFAYVGPCEPRGSVDYIFRLYALNDILPLSGPVAKGALFAAMNGHVLDSAEVPVIHNLRNRNLPAAKSSASVPAKSGTSRP